MHKSWFCGFVLRYLASPIGRSAGAHASRLGLCDLQKNAVRGSQLGRTPAVHNKDRASDESGVVGGQKRHGAADVLRLPEVGFVKFLRAKFHVWTTPENGGVYRPG